MNKKLIIILTSRTEQRITWDQVYLGLVLVLAGLAGHTELDGITEGTAAGLFFFFCGYDWSKSDGRK